MFPRKATEKDPGRSAKPAVVVRNLTKEFVIPHERKTTLFENIRGVFQPSVYEKFVVLNDVSFTVDRGDSLGIVGFNGSGKSTLLKLIANILRPTAGSIEVNGRITPFLELGVGFQNDLTARENIEVYSTMMGLGDGEIKKNMDSVLEFAGLTQFRDTKLKNFSSGMQVRLAFATAIQRRPEILLVDEVLAVGDMDFQKKCLDVFKQFREQGVTMLFVSHDLSSVRKFCNKTLLLRRGGVYAFGETNQIVDRYIYSAKPREPPAPAGNGAEKAGSPARAPAANPGTARPAAGQLPEEQRKVAITALEFIDKHGAASSNFVTGDPMTIRVRYEVRQVIDALDFSITIYNEAGVYCYATDTQAKNYTVDRTAGKRALDLVIGRIPMLDGVYYITVAAAPPSGDAYDWHEKEYSFVVQKETPDSGLFEIDCRWALPGPGNGHGR
ncbi:MAG: Trehalose/maltose import ATP-binding protein MalK [Methanocella sp. PtaU1.Bin125]|nr:MAG: Trehalose/maltose import ATP-binding protein MalK [Methanocella sp. PtaU1.Bin125]